MRPVNHGDGYGAGNSMPVLPAVESHQIVSTHHPHEARCPISLGEKSERDGRVGTVEFGFETGYLHTWLATSQLSALSQALGLRREAVVAFQRISRCNDPPKLIELQAVKRSPGNDQVTLMGWIE